MIKKQELELTWIGKENRSRLEPRLRWIADNEEASRQRSGAGGREAVIQVCAGPRCGCFNVRIQFQPPAVPGDIWFDLNERKPLLSPEQEHDPECLRVGEMICAALAGAAQQQLREWFLAEKLEIIGTTPVLEIDIANLPDASDGAMIGFVEVFPCGSGRKYKHCCLIKGAV